MSRDAHPLASPSGKDRVFKKDESNRIEAHCCQCGKDTLHYRVHTLERREHIGAEAKIHLYEFIQCRGCESASMIHRWSRERSGWIVEYFPSQIGRPIPAWVEKLGEPSIGGKTGKDLVELLNEIYEAVRGGQHRIAAMGIRALIEQVMIEKVGDVGSFSKNLNALQERGYIALIQRETLENILEAGHGAMHRFFSPTKEDLTVLLDVTEVVLQALFIQLPASSYVADRVPPRKRPGKPGNT